MDQKSWLWKKRSKEKTLVVADKANNSLSRYEEDKTEVQERLREKTELERDLRILNEKLSSALAECNAKDDIAKKQVKIAEEAIAGWEKAETEAISLKQELDKVLQQKAASEERLGHLDAALKECMHQLRFVREEQEKIVHGEFEKMRIALDEKLMEAGKRLAKLDAENTQLSKALSGKDKVIVDLHKFRTQVEADLNALMLRVESTEKENASLQYEVRVLEKELDIRNEEREFTCRTADVAQKQHQESVKNIAKLETECQRLRLLVRKRLPGPAAWAKMKNEVGMLGKDQLETRRRTVNPSPTSPMDFCIEVTPDAKRINSLIEQLYMMEEENRVLKDALDKKSSELQFSRTTSTRTASSLSRVGQVEETLKGQTTAEAGKHICFLQEHSLTPSSDVGSDDKASCAESWSSALISEIEHFKNEKQLGTSSHGTTGISEMSLMDDFAEMEKLAVVSVDYPAGSSHRFSEEGTVIIGTSGSPSGGHSLSAPHRELVPVSDCPSEPLISGQEIQSEYIAANRVPGHVSQTSPTKSLNLDASNTGNENNISNTKTSGLKFRSNVSLSIHKILELLQGINIRSQDNAVAESLSGKDDKILSYKNSETPTGYMVRVFQWKTAELSAILQQFVQTCNDLLNGTADLEQFAQQVASNLEWIMNHCFSLQDVSSMKDAIMNHLDWDESRSESEVDSRWANHSAECNRLRIQTEDMSYPPMVSPLSRHNSSCQMEALPPTTCNIEPANREASVVDLEGRLQSEIVKGECFRVQLQESKDITENLHSEMETMEQFKGKTGNQIEKQNMMKEDLETQLMETNHERRNACQTISRLENELGNKNNSCKRLEETSHDPKIQPKSMMSKEVSDNGKHWEKQLQNDWEIAAASEKLAECQETILNLGKQLKALASPSDAALFNKVVSTPADSVVTGHFTPQKSISRRSSLLDKMLAEDNDQTGASPRAKKDIQNGNSNSAVRTNAPMESWGKFTNPNGINHDDKSKTTVASMDIVPCKKNGGRSFFKKLFCRQKKGKTDKTAFS